MWPVPAAWLVALAPLLVWHPVRAGVQRTTFPLRATGILSHVQVIALRIAPCAVRFTTERRTADYGLRNAWSIDSLDDATIVAFDGGQFRGTMPWGWYVHDGRELQPTGVGPLSLALTIDSSDHVALHTIAEINSARMHLRDALQSYPTLLVDGVIPAALRPGAHDIDLTHRDSRLAIGITAHDELLIVITRVGGSGGAVGMLPLGPTVPELAAIMQRLGAVRAVGLDGGLSSQLAVRDSSGALMALRNWRRVPIGIVGRAGACTGSHY
jgi:Phosphodiester glycosidase